LHEVVLRESLLEGGVSFWALLAGESEIDFGVVEVRCVEDPVGGDQLVVEDLVEVLGLLSGPGDLAAGETWVHGAVEGEYSCRGETSLVEVVDTTHATATFLCDSCHKLLIEGTSDSESADSQMRWQILYLFVHVISVPDLSISQDKDSRVLSELLLVDDAPGCLNWLIELSTAKISFKLTNRFDCL